MALYIDAIIDALPAFCVQGSEVWRSRTTLISFHIVELHVPNRVLRQFGLLQHIPIQVETIRHVTSQGRPDEDWTYFHAAHIERWGQRLQAIIDQHPIVGDDPRPLLTYQPQGQTERALNFHQPDYTATLQNLISRPPPNPSLSTTINTMLIEGLYDFPMIKTFDSSTLNNWLSVLHLDHQSELALNHSRYRYYIWLWRR
ncbi:Serine/threonine-protein phosphatase, partial [Ananas comosus]